MTGARRTAAKVSGGGAPRSPAREAEYAAHWEDGWWRGRVVRTARDELYTIIYEGRRGGGAGPDFRDAVLARPDGVRMYGDVELHLRAANWRAHGHDTDSRYAGVVLHIVFTPLPPLARVETALPHGGAAPIAVLSRDRPAPTTSAAKPWPCVQLASRLTPRRLNALLLEAGNERFARRQAQFMRDIAEAEARAAVAGDALWNPRDRTLFVAIAEALGYGRDRDALRAAGMALLTSRAADAAGPTGLRDSVERSRLAGLLDLRCRWRERGPWPAVSERLVSGPPRAAAAALTAELGASSGRISPGRARIVAANVVLPFAAACATLDGDTALEARSRALYEVLPGPPSNAITRLMSRQLGLSRLPSGAASQQGLHHLWAEWCREKRCETCPCARTTFAPRVTSRPRRPRKPATLVGGAGLQEPAASPAGRYNLAPSPP